jgi:hypothetical protein
MKLKLSAICLFITALFIVGCGGDKNGKPASNANQAVQKKINYKHGDEYMMRYGFTEGISHVYNIISTSENTQSQGTQSQTSKIELKYSLTLNPSSSDSTGETSLKIKFNSIKVNAAVGAQNFSYDSENPADTAKRKTPAFAEYVAFQNADFETRLGSNGEILEIYKVDNILKNILAENADKVNDNLKNQLRTNIEEQLKSISQQLFQYLPVENVKVNSVWNRTTTEKLGEEDTKNIAQYKLLNVENRNGKDVALINANLTSETAQRKSVENKGSKYDFDKPQISGNGQIEFDLENGLVIKRDLLTNISLGMSVTQGANKMKVLTKVRNAVKVELVK